MKIRFIKYDNIAAIKSNLNIWSRRFCEKTSEWLEDEFEGRLFSETKFGEVKDFNLDMSKEKASSTDAENTRIIYENLGFLTDSQASDERLWAGLCIDNFWEYVKYRWNIDENATGENIKQHYFFGYGPRRSLTRNAVSRLWWIGRLTYDNTRKDPYELTDLVCENSNYIMSILERNTSNSPMITRAFLSALLDARKEGIIIDTDLVKELSKYLNLLGGIYILDCLQSDVIHNKILEKARVVSKKK